MHTQHVKFSTYVAWGGVVGGVVAVGAVFEEGEVSGMEEADDDVDGMVLEVVVVVVVVAVVVTVVVGVVVAAVVSFVPSLSPTFSLFESSSFFFLGNNAFFSAAAASAAAFNRLHSLLCPPSFQCFIWHSGLQ